MPAPTKVQLIGGVFQDSEGNPLANGYLLMDLSQDGFISGVGQICSGIELKIQLDANGSVVTNPVQSVWGNDQMAPVNSYYRVTGYTAQGQRAWGPNNQQVLGSGGTFDTGTWVPNVPLSWTPAITSPLLETNGTKNATQTILNLIAGSNITLTADGAGGVTIAASGATVPGAISITKTENLGGVGSTPINVTTEGTKDWLSIGSAISIAALNTFTSGVHSKVLGGWIGRSFLAWGPNGTVAAFNTPSTPWTFTSNIGDDAVQGNVLDGQNILNAINLAVGYSSNSASLISGGFGFRFEVPATTTTRNCNIYLAFKSGGTQTGNSFNITARLADGSAADQTLTFSPGDTNFHFYKINIQFNAGSTVVPLIVNCYATQAVGDSFTDIAFGAITLF